MKGLQLILSIIFSDRERDRLSRAYNKEHTRRIKGATQALQRELKSTTMLKATKKVFHSKCGNQSHCCSNDAFEKEVLIYLKMQQQQQQQEEEQQQQDWEDASLERRLKKELEIIVKKRNEAAYQLLQQHFAKSHMKRALLGEHALDATERLLCDYESVEELKIASDTALLFRRVHEWVTTRIPGQCRSCGKKATIKCAQCGQRCFCSIPCQVKDEANRLFCHQHECVTQLEEV